MQDFTEFNSLSGQIMFNNDPREPRGSRITESGTMSNLSLVVEQDGAVRLRPEAEIHEILKYRFEHSKELAKLFEIFGLRRRTPDELPDSQGEEAFQPEREEIELPGKRIESGSVNVVQPHRSSAPSPEEFSSVKSVKQIPVIEGAAGPSWEGETNNEWPGEEFSDANGVPGDEDSLPSESDQIYQRKMPAGELSNFRHRVILPIVQPDDFRECRGSFGARGLLGLDTCTEKLQEGETLRAYRHIQTGKRPFPCDVCGKGFIQSGHLKVHRRIHTGEKPFACDICGERFTQSGNLNVHRRKHAAKKPFPCDVCGKRFIQARDLRSHQRIHTGEKPFPCEICGKRFTNSGDWKRHRRIHTGEKPFACDVCGKRFTQSGDMRRHRRTHADKKPIVCDV